ncbi:High-affinity potassium transport protein [Lachnellula subtilissima]|uniref:Potassium transport protein n=1 Tax=Lachnellula subtilissima TaxID=602034 RepID=A0A8H8UBV3_9HELO|nr:High-affinity potassium transport protein [Lachnellula subtilissima]
MQSFLPPLNFITVHYTYFICTCLLASLIFYLCSDDPAYSISYTDSLFMVVSAMTEAGLNTVNLSTMSTAQQVLLWFLILIGSAVFVSVGTVFTRKRVFEQRFRHIVKTQKEERRERRRSLSLGRDEEGEVGKRLRGLRGEDEHVDRREFESRHSGPRDPTPGLSSNGPAAGGIKLQQMDRGEREDEVVLDEEARADLEGSHNPVSSQSTPHVHTQNEHHHHRVLSFVGVGAHPNPHPSSSAYTYSSHTHAALSNADGAREGLSHRQPYFSAKEKELDASTESGEGAQAGLNTSQYPDYLTRHTTGRNAQFYGLSRAEREHLGGVEYRAITLLAYVVPIYFVMWQVLGCVGLGAYMAYNKAEVARGNGINPWWLGVFNGVSAFNNSGMSLLDANMIPFQSATYPVITMGLLILAGNTAYPLFLRLILWCMLKLLCLIYPSPEMHSEHKATLRFVLKYPRRVYTNLFPSAQTWWLLFMVVVLNGIDWAAFELLNIGNSAVDVIPPHFRVLDGLFQALAVRSGGFYIISIPSLRIGLQVLYVIMMYISVYPVVITMRHSNVYEERSLGIYAEDSHSHSASDLELGPSHPKSGTLFRRFKRTLSNIQTPLPPTTTTAGTQFIRLQLRSQLSHDLWWLVLALLFITCIEVSHFERDPVTYSVFNIAFEVVSAYGCVGISPGLPTQAYSFSGGWHKASKLILCAVMIRGRHRGLPVALDRAVRLPGGEGGEGERGV